MFLSTCFTTDILSYIPVGARTYSSSLLRFADRSSPASNKSSGGAQSPPPSSEKNESNSGKQNDEDDDDSKTSMLPRAFLWMIAAYSTVTVLSFLMPSSENAEGLRFISWNEFVYQMLQNGEVDQVVVKPDANLATVFLHDGAIIKGRRAGKILSQPPSLKILRNGSLEKMPKK